MGRIGAWNWSRNSAHALPRPLRAQAQTDTANVARFLAATGEPTELPRRSPGRGPPYWKSRVLRRQALGEEDDDQDRWVPQPA